MSNSKFQMARTAAAALMAVLVSGAAQAAQDAGLPGEFLNYGAGARPLAMGGAFTGVADDVDALYWNPAGLSTFRSNQVTFQYAPLPVDGGYHYLAYTQPLYTYGNIGLGVVNLDSGKIPKVDNNVEIGTFGDRETAYLLSYAKSIKQLGLGLTLKSAEHVIDSRKKSGFGADLGSVYTVNDRVQMGAMVRNAIAPSYSYDTEKEEFPTVLRVGSAVKFYDNRLLTALDLEKTIGTQQSLRWHLGVEGYTVKNISLRLGANPSEFTAGVGIRFKSMQFDYGAGFGEPGLMNRMSVKAYFGGYEIDVKASPTVFSPVGLKDKTTFKIYTTHRERIVKWVLSIRNSKAEVVRSFRGFNAPPAVLEWDGRDSNGNIVPPGTYAYRMAMTDTKKKTETTAVRQLRIDAPTPFEIESK